MAVSTDQRKTGVPTPQTRRPRAATVGSSLTDVCYVSSALYGVRRRLNRSWIDFANYNLGEKALDLRYTYAVGGNTIAQILEQIRTAVSQDVEWIIGDLGVINSIGAAVSVSTMQAQVKQCIDAIVAGGKKGLLLNSTPLVTGHASASLSTHRQIAAVNRVMTAYAKQKGVLVVDAHAALVDGTSANGYADADYYQADLIHYAHTGARVLGPLVATALEPHLDDFPLLPCSQADSYHATDNPDQLCTNPLMAGTATVTVGAGITGDMPTGRALSAAGGTFTGTSAVTSRADGFGNDWVITVTAASAGDARLFMTLEPDMTANVTTGDLMEAVASVEITGATNLKGHLFKLSPSGASDYAGIHEITTESSLIAEYSQSDLTGGMFIAPELTLPAGSTNLRLFLELQWSSTTAAAVIKVGLVGIRRIV